MAQERYESAPADPKPLGEPLHFAFSGKTASNRFLKASMTERLSTWSPTDLAARGYPTPELINLYKRWGEGGIGLILSGNLMIEPNQLEAPGNAIIPRTDPISGPRFDAFSSLAAGATAHGSLLVGQVSHPGRQTEARLQPDPVSASDVQLEGEVMGMRFNKPHAASPAEISQIIEGFAHAAEYLDAAGFSGIELHAAHGYLLAQFMSTTTNKRDDQYGGSLENRGRLICEIAQEVRRRTRPGFILGIKLNSVEFQAGGFQPDEARELCETLERNGFDFVELSGGTYEELAFEHKRESSKKREAFFLEFADQIVPALTKTRVYVTGGFKTVGAMVSALDTVDGVGLGRPITQEPNIARDIVEGRVSGVIKQKFDDSNFGLTNVVAGSQIRQIGKDHAPMDGSKEENVNAFMKDMGAWSDAMSKDTKIEKYGYVDIDSLPAVPYATAAVA